MFVERRPGSESQAGAWMVTYATGRYRFTIGPVSDNEALSVLRAFVAEKLLLVSRYQGVTDVGDPLPPTGVSC